MTFALESEHLFDLRLLGDAHLSADGKDLICVETWHSKEENRGRSRLMIATRRADGGYSDLRPFTYGPSDRSPLLSPDGRTIAFLSQRSGSAQIWLIDRDGGEPRQLSRIHGGISQIAWLPDGSGFLGIAEIDPEGLREEGDPEPTDLYRKFTRDVKVIDRQYYKLDGYGFFGQRRRQIAHVAMDGKVSLLTSGPYDHDAPTPSPDGRQIAVVTSRLSDPDGAPHIRDVYLMDPSGENLRRLTGERLDCGHPTWFPDGSAIAFTATDPVFMGYGNERLYTVDLDGHERCLSEYLDRPLGDTTAGDLPLPAVQDLGISADGTTIFAQVSDHGNVGIVAFGTRDLSARLVLGGERVIASASFSGGLAALAFANDANPAIVSVADLATGEEREIARAHTEWLDKGLLTRPRRFQFRAEGGPPVDGWLLMPPNSRGPRIPAILEIHGGPMSMYGSRMFFEFHILASQGYAVVYTNPRGSLGYGQSFCDCIMGEWGDKDYKDVMSGLDAALALEPSLDPGRLGVTGGSYGGFMVNWIVSHNDRFRVAVTSRSVVNRMSAMGTSDLGYLRIPQYGPLWWENPEPYLQQSPLTYASAIHTPLLIEHQEGDLRCPLDQGEQLYAALKVLGRETLFVRYPGEFHGMSRTGKPWNRVHRLRTMVEWFKGHIPG